MLSWAKEIQSFKFAKWVDVKKLEQCRSKDDLNKDVLMHSLNFQNLWFQWEYQSKNIQGCRTIHKQWTEGALEAGRFHQDFISLFSCDKLVCAHD